MVNFFKFVFAGILFLDTLLYSPGAVAAPYTSNQVRDLTDVLSLEIQLYSSTDLKKVKNDPKAQQNQSALNKIFDGIENNKTSLMKTAEGKNLLQMARRFKTAQKLNLKLSDCIKSENGEMALRGVMNAVLSDNENCTPFLQDAEFNKLLAAANKSLTLSSAELLKESSHLTSEIFKENLFQAALRMAEMQQSLKDFPGRSKDLVDSLCGEDGTPKKWCTEFLKQAGYNSKEQMRKELAAIMQQRKAELTAQGVVPQTSEALGKKIKCEIIGCGSQKGLLTTLDSQFSVQKILDPASPSLVLENMQSGKSTSLSWQKEPQMPASQVGMFSEPEVIQKYVQDKIAWKDAIENQAQTLIMPFQKRLASMPVLQILATDPNLRNALCLPQCQVSLSEDVSGKHILILKNSSGARLNTQLTLMNLERDPKAVIDKNMARIEDALTVDLAKIGSELFDKNGNQSAAQSQSNQNMAKLIQGNPVAAGRAMLNNPETIGAFCVALSSIPKENPWLLALAVVGGIGATVVAGIVAGPIGVAVVGAAVGIGSAAYSFQQASQMNQMARHYELACATQSTLDDHKSCDDYHRENLNAQGMLLAGAVDIATLGVGSNYRNLLKQTIEGSSSLSLSLRSLKTMETSLIEIKKVLSPKNAQLLDSQIKDLNVLQKTDLVTNLNQAKRFLKPEKFKEALDKAIQKACGTSSVR